MNMYVLEEQTQKFLDQVQAKGGPPIYKLTPVQARALLETVQSHHDLHLPVRIEDKVLPVGPSGKVSIRIVRPEKGGAKLPTVMYYHGAGWVMGSANTHDRLVRELAIGANAAFVFINYSLSPEAKFPTAIEEAYAATKYVYEQGPSMGLDVSHFAIAGDSVGGNMAIAMALLAKERRGPKIERQVLFYPVTDSGLDTPSYQEFANGPWLTKAAMEWFWSAYESNAAARKHPLMSPLHAPLDQLQGLPPTLIITADHDVLRDEGERFASRLMQAKVDVTAMRFLGTIHDFAMLNALSKTPAARGAIALACHALKGNR